LKVISFLARCYLIVPRELCCLIVGFFFAAISFFRAFSSLVASFLSFWELFSTTAVAVDSTLRFESQGFHTRPTTVPFFTFSHVFLPFSSFFRSWPQLVIYNPDLPFAKSTRTLFCNHFIFLTRFPVCCLRPNTTFLVGSCKTLLSRSYRLHLRRLNLNFDFPVNFSPPRVSMETRDIRSRYSLFFLRLSYFFFQRPRGLSPHQFCQLFSAIFSPCFVFFGNQYS